MPSELIENVTRTHALIDEVRRLREENINLRIASAMWIRLYEQALKRTASE